jgi:hypothetical protein
MYRAGNLAAVLKVGPNEEKQFIQFGAVPADQRRTPEDRLSPYFL